MAQAKTSTKPAEAEVQTEAAEPAPEPKSERKAPGFAADAGKAKAKPSNTVSDTVVLFYDNTMVKGLNATDLAVQLPVEAAAAAAPMGNAQTGPVTTTTTYIQSFIYPGLQPMKRDEWEKWQQSQSPLAKAALGDPAAIQVVLESVDEFSEFSANEQVRLVRLCSTKAAVPLLNAWAKLTENTAVKQEITAQSAKLSAPDPYGNMAAFAA